MARLIPHTRGPWKIQRRFGSSGVISGGVMRKYANGSGQDQLFMICIPQEDNGGTQAQDGNALLCAESSAMYLALELMAAGKARLVRSESGQLVEFVFGHIAYVLSDADDRWTLVITAIGWDRVYRELGE